MDVKIALKEHLSTELNNQFAALEPPELFIHPKSIREKLDPRLLIEVGDLDQIGLL